MEEAGFIHLDNVVIDTSAICETESFRAALKAFGPRRILWGSDFAVSELRGRCVTTGDYFYWLHPDAKIAQRLYVLKMQEHGILVSSIFYLMLAHKERHINILLKTLELVLGEIDHIIEAGRLREEAGSGFSQAGFARLA